MNIENYDGKYHKQIVDLVLSIQQQEFAIPITYEDQPDLADISGFFDDFLVATIDGRPIGTIGMKIINDYAVLRKMFVSSEYRGKAYGVAQKLLTELENKVRQSGIENIYLGTTKFYNAAHRFYEKNAYEEIQPTHLPEGFPRMQVDSKFYRKVV